MVMQPFQARAEPSTTENAANMSSVICQRSKKDETLCYFKYTCLQQTFQYYLMEGIDIFHCLPHLSRSTLKYDKQNGRTSVRSFLPTPRPRYAGLEDAQGGLDVSRYKLWDHCLYFYKKHLWTAIEFKHNYFIFLSCVVHLHQLS